MPLPPALEEEMSTDNRVTAGMYDDDNLTVQVSLNDVDATIADILTVNRKTKKGDSTMPVLRVTYAVTLDNGDVVTRDQDYTMAFPNDGVEATGEQFSFAKPDYKLNKYADAVKWTRAMLSGGVSKDEWAAAGSVYSFFKGLKVRLMPVTNQGPDGKDQVSEDNGRAFTSPMPVRIYGKDPAPGGMVSQNDQAPPFETEEDRALATEIVTAILQRETTILRKDLRAAVAEEIKGRGLERLQSDMVNHICVREDFLSALEGATYENGVLSLV